MNTDTTATPPQDAETVARGYLSLHDRSGEEIGADGYERQPVELVEARGSDVVGVTNRSRIEFGELDGRATVDSTGVWIGGEEKARAQFDKEAAVRPRAIVVIREGDVAFSIDLDD